MKTILPCLICMLAYSGIVTAQNTPGVQNPKISNAIRIATTKEIKLKAAYLYFDDGKRVPDSNIASIKQNVNLMVQIERGGWKEKDGIVSIGATEKIFTNTGKQILDEPDLFATFTNISAADAQYITLKAVITSQAKKFDYFVVRYTIWDKWGTGKIAGSYRLRIR